MNSTPYIQVILPLKLEWEPFYELPGAQVGDRIDLVFARRHYVGVVSAVNVLPPPGMKVRGAVPTELQPVFAEEIAFWRRLSSYYLCTVGEVYKLAHPMRQIQSERITRRRAAKEEDAVAPAVPAPLPSSLKEKLDAIQQAFYKGNTVLLDGEEGKTALYLELVRQTLEKGKSALCLVPEVKCCPQMEARLKAVFPAEFLRFDSSRTLAARRETAAAVRSGRPCVVLGTRGALFLPWNGLGLVIVDEEQDATYKQDSPAPRYHAREAAILLGLEQKAPVLLGSSTPSLESLYNADSARFTCVNLQRNFTSEVHLLNLSAEQRKKGLSGSFTLKLLERMHAVLSAGESVLLICPSKASLDGIREELPFPTGTPIELATPASFKALKEKRYGLVGVLLADILLGKEDFRSDEHSLQLLQQLQLMGKELVLQTREAGHPVYKALKEGLDARVFLQERREAAYPPVTRLVDIHIVDGNLPRLEKLSVPLVRELGFSCIGSYAKGPEEKVIRLVFQRDKNLQQEKVRLLERVLQFETKYKYSGHIHLDVDPV